MAIAVVYLPMVSGDARSRALAQAAFLAGPRVRSFWAGERALGLACGREYGATQIPLVLATLEADDPIRELLESRRDDPGPMWDIAYFYDAGARWPTGGLPDLAAWTKQFEYFIDDDGHAGGGFFHGARGTAEMVWTSWEEEFSRGMAAVAADRPADGEPSPRDAVPR